MHKLVIDYGNSIIKAAIFEGDELAVRKLIDKDPVDGIADLLREYPAKRAILSSVSVQQKGLSDFLEKNMEFFVYLDHTTPLPIKNLYRTPESLGYDRIAAAAGAYTIFPGSDVLIIDAGTALTLDFLARKGEFLGGNISPGRRMRALALNAYTSRLPVVETEGDAPLLANNTQDALKAGILNGMIFEMEGYIRSVKEKYKELKIILTGGDAKYFDKKLNYSIFVDSNLNLTGLNCILDHNAQK